MDKPLEGLRVLVPPSRPEVNPLLRALEMRGAEVVEWPRIFIAVPVTFAPMDAAIAGLKKFDWVLFAGGPCVRNFFARLSALGVEPGRAFGGRRVAAVGHGALAALKEHGVAANAYPKRHVAADVASALEASGPLVSKKVLLVRVAGAARALPELLEQKGAEVSEVEGYRLDVEAGPEMPARSAVLALANPTAVRVLMRGLAELRLLPEEFLAGVAVASVGPATTEEAAAVGLRVALSSRGSQAALVADIVARFGRS